MIDFHTHILPHIDDGSSGYRESLKLLRKEAEQGITEVVLTPHFYSKDNSPSQFVIKRNEVFDSLQELWNPNLPIMHLGAEVQYFEGLCHVDDIEQLRIQGTELLLLEMPFCAWSGRVLDDVFDLNRRPGIQVVLAHIERYLYMQHKNIVSELLNEGILIQSNLSFFINWKSRRRALSMLERNEIHVLGSDCHNMQKRIPKWNSLPKKVFAKAEEKSKLLLDEFFHVSSAVI